MAGAADIGERVSQEGDIVQYTVIICIWGKVVLTPSWMRWSYKMGAVLYTNYVLPFLSVLFNLNIQKHEEPEVTQTQVRRTRMQDKFCQSAKRDKESGPLILRVLKGLCRWLKHMVRRSCLCSQCLVYSRCSLNGSWRDKQGFQDNSNWLIEVEAES